MRKFYLIGVLSIAIVMSAIVFTSYTVTSLNSYKAKKEAISQALNFEDRIMSTKEWLSSDATTETLYASTALAYEAEKFYEKAVYYGLLLVGFLLVYCIAIGYYYWQQDQFNQMFGIALVVSSLCLIYLGLQTPFLEIEAFSSNLAFKVPIDIGFWKKTFEKTFEGKVSYFYQNKSIFQLIKLLFTGGNIVVGIALVLFSIVFPLFKLCSSLFVLVFPKHAYAENFKAFILLIGKWSMADVFVAGIFLAFFSFSNMNVGVETSSATLLGLYFFLAFVVLSIASSYFVKKAI